MFQTIFNKMISIYRVSDKSQMFTRGFVTNFTFFEDFIQIEESGGVIEYFEDDEEIFTNVDSVIYINRNNISSIYFDEGNDEYGFLVITTLAETYTYKTTHEDLDRIKKEMFT